MELSLRSPIRLIVLLFLGLRMCNGSSKCYTPDTIDYDVANAYCDQPLFAAFVPKTEELQLVDNICFTYFPLPDDLSTFTVYEATVYCDGSYNIETFIATVVGTGQDVLASAYRTIYEYIIGYAGCDTYIVYRCTVLGDFFPTNFVAGFSPSCKSIGLSCLRKVQEVICDRGLPEEDYYILPMKLPNRCVTQQLCLQPPNPFFNTLPSVGLF